MQTITDYKYIANAQIAIRAKKEGFVTNFFIEEERCNLLIKKCLLYSEIYENCSFVFYKDHDFYHLYFFATNEKQLSEALNKLVQRYPKMVFIADIIEKKSILDRLISIYEQAGFNKYINLYRMNRLKNLDDPQTLDPRVKYATLDHSEQIHELLETYFDKYSEQIPLIEEITKLISKNNIIIIEEDQKVIGFAIFEIKGVTSYWRYWFIHPDYRNKKVGTALSRRVFHECRDTKRQLLWVISNNENAIMRHQHYGFEAEQLSDQIMIKKIEYETTSH